MLESKMPSFLSILKQKAKIIVDENGTEASAVTMGGMRCTAMRHDISKVYDFVANHPFEYYIVYSGSSEHSSMVLFEGYLYKIIFYELLNSDNPSNCFASFKSLVIK